MNCRIVSKDDSSCSRVHYLEGALTRAIELIEKAVFSAEDEWQKEYMKTVLRDFQSKKSGS